MAQETSENEIDEPVIAIGVLAQRVGLSVSAVRRYEDEGLIISHRTRSGHRLFSYEDIGRVRNIHRMIQDLGLNMEGIRRMQALLPCWDLAGCGEETRKMCRAYRGNAIPCWASRGSDCACHEDSAEENACRQCVVYRFGSLCTEDIKSLLHDQNDEAANGGAAIRELVQRLRSSRRED